MLKKDIFHSSYSTFPADKQKRKKARIQVDITGRLEIPGHPKRECQITSISTGGLSILVNTALYIGEHLRIYFTLNDAPIVAEAEVMRLTGKEVGLRFTAIDDSATERIQQFIYRDMFSK